MSEELEAQESQPVTTEEAAPAPQVITPTESSPPPPAATTVNWLEELEKADHKTLRSHPKIAGIIGSEIQRARQEEQARIQSEAAMKAAREAEEQMLKLAQEDPVNFAEKYLTEYEQNKIRSQLDGIKGQTRQELAASVGRAFNELPEWAELNDKDHESLARAMIGLNEDDVIPVFTHKALELLSEKRGAKKFEQWKQKDLPKEREALRQEEAARLLKTSDAPDTTAPKGSPAKSDIGAMKDEEFDQYWKQKFG